jgi:hypothetical protein
MMPEQWTGWHRGPGGRWHAIVEPSTLSECAHALEAELRRRGIRASNQDMCLTAHGGPPIVRPAHPQDAPPAAQDERHGEAEGGTGP